MKRVISFLLVLCMMLSLVPTAALAVETTVPEQSTEVQNSAVSIDGTNSFGALLASDLQEHQEQTDEDYEDGYAVVGVTIQGNTATVEYSSLEEAMVVVGLYTEDGLQLLASGKALADPDQRTVAVTIDGTIPQYFTATAYLVDTYDFSPLCTAYSTPMYTQSMQELLASTTEDYDPQQVLNLDDDDATNFAVFQDGVIQLSQAEGVNTVISADEEAMRYVIGNPSETITSLQKGDILAYSYSNSELLILKVDTVTLSGTTATLTGAELEMEEVFSHVKIENTGETGDMTVDTSSMDQGLTYLGTETEEAPATRHDGEVSVKVSLAFEIEKEWDNIKLSGGLKLGASVKFSYYITLERQFIELKTETSTALEIEVSGKVDFPVMELGSLGYSPVPGVYIGFEPELVVRFSAKVGGSIESKSTGGFSYERGKGVQNLTTKPETVVTLTAEGTVFFGVDLKPHIAILDGWALKLTLKSLAGIELKASMGGTLYDGVHIGGTANQQESVHSCEKCLEVELYLKAEFTLELEFLKFIKPSVKLKAIKNKIGVCHYSFDENRFGFGECPNKAYRVTVYVQDGDGEPLDDVSVTMSVQGQAGTSPFGVTNENGIAIKYLTPENYCFSAIVEGEEQFCSHNVKQAVKIVLNPNVPAFGSAFDHMGMGTVTDNGRIIKSGSCGSDLTYTLYESGLMYISGTGKMTNWLWSGTRAPWYSNSASIKKIVIGSGVTTIGDYAFHNCKSLTSVTIPDSVITIGIGAFYDCDSLTTVTIPDGVTTIGRLAFNHCGSLTTVTIPDGVTSIGDSTFYYCTNLTSVTIPDSVTTIGSQAFDECYRLTSVTIPDSVTTIGGLAFYACNDLASVTIGNSVTTIGRGAFQSCTELTSVTIPDSVTTIGESAFEGCTGLTIIIFKGSAPSIGSDCFYGVTATAYYPTGNDTWILNVKHNYGGNITWDNGCLLGSVNNPIEIGATSYLTSIIAIPDRETYYAISNAFNEQFLYILGEENITITLNGNVLVADEDGLYSAELDGDPVNQLIVTNTGEKTLELVATIDYPVGSIYNPIIINEASDLTSVVAEPDGETYYAINNGLNGKYLTVSGNKNVTITFNGSILVADEDGVYRAKLNRYPVNLLIVANTGKTMVKLSAAIVDAPESDISTILTKKPATRAIYGGDYSTEGTLKTATFTGLVPEQEYLLLALVSTEAEDILAADNLLNIRQATAGTDGTLTFTYVQRVATPLSYVVACGASNKNLQDAQITFPTMGAQEQAQAIHPQVFYDGELLSEGTDYVLVGTVDYAEAATYTCYVRGIYDYTGLVACSYTVRNDLEIVHEEQGDLVTLKCDTEADMTLTADTYIDLAGFDLFGTIDRNGYALYCMDSATDNYTCDGMGYFSCVDENGDTIIPVRHFKSDISGSVKRYMTIGTDDGYTFHRFYLGITHMNLKPSVTGFGYRAVFCGDEMVIAQLDESQAYGFTLQLEGKHPVSAFKSRESFVSGKTITLGLRNYDMEQYGETALNASVALKLTDGTVIETEPVSMSMRSMLELLDAKYADFTHTQLAQVKAMLEKYEIVSQWGLSNLI